MKDNYSWLTPKQAADLIGYTPRAVQNYITNGKLSATREDGRWYIDKAEFFRVFPAAHRKEMESSPEEKAAQKKRLEFENELLKEMASKKDQEIEFLRKQVEFISTEKVKMLDAIVSHTRLLEHHQKSDTKDIDPKKKSIADGEYYRS